MFTGNSDNIRVIEVHDLKRETEIRAFLQGAVYAWCNNNGKEVFTIHNILAFLNRNWISTPLEELYFRNLSDEKTEDESIEQAGKEAGKILKKVLSDDKREFHTVAGFRVREYSWTGRENNGNGLVQLLNDNL